ncbi:MAG: hypothetical protein ACI80V_003015 [Rhodothermales bacterium]|jgi:hypothetical protein
MCRATVTTGHGTDGALRDLEVVAKNHPRSLPGCSPLDSVMTPTPQPLPSFLAEPTRLGKEISITGKWIPAKPGGLFRKSADSKEMLKESEDIHLDARNDPGVLSTEINHAVGEDAVLVHHVFRDSDALIQYFSTTATRQMGALSKVAKPQAHLVRGVSIPASVREALLAKDVAGVFGEHLFGYVREETCFPIRRRPSWSPPSGRASQASQTAWKNSSTGGSGLVTDANSMEGGAAQVRSLPGRWRRCANSPRGVQRQRRTQIPSVERHGREVPEGHRQDCGGRVLFLPRARLVDHQDILQILASAGYVLEPR